MNFPHWTVGQEFDVMFASEAEAKVEVERRGDGSIVKWANRGDGRPMSCAMQVFEGGAWRRVNIHG